MFGPLHMAVMCYGIGILPRLRTLPRKQLFEVLREADRVSETVPVHMHPEPTLRVASWGPRPMSGGQVAALLVFGLWVACHEDEQIAAPLVESWPIKEVILICGTAADSPGAAADAGEELPLLALMNRMAANPPTAGTSPNSR